MFEGTLMQSLGKEMNPQDHEEDGKSKANLNSGCRGGDRHGY